MVAATEESHKWIRSFSSYQRTKYRGTYALIALGYTMVYGILRSSTLRTAILSMVGAFAAISCGCWE